MTSEFDWAYVILGFIAYQIVKMLFLTIRQEIKEHREKKFIKLVNIEFPDSGDITYIAIESSDKESMTKLENQLRDQYPNIQNTDLNKYAGRERNEHPRFQSARHHKDSHGN